LFRAFPAEAGRAFGTRFFSYKVLVADKNSVIIQPYKKKELKHPEASGRSIGTIANAKH
jgi:hypothetical protein